MAALVILSPLPAIGVTASRGEGASRLLTPSPREAFYDSSSGSAVTLTLDLGSTYSVDSLFLGSTNADVAATWAVSSGVAAAGETAWGTATMAAPYRRSERPRMSFYRRAAPITARYVSATISQPSGAPALFAGNMAAGLAFQPVYGNEYGGGRQPIDTGAAEAIVDGGFGTFVGVRKMAYGCTLGDLQSDEVEQLCDIYLDKGQTLPIVLIEGALGAPFAPTAEQIHWGRFAKLEAYERLDPLNTKWGVQIEEWR